MAKKSSYRTSGLLLIASLLTACATPPASKTPANDPAPQVAQTSTVATTASEPTPPPEDANYPKQALTRELLFGMLLGDIAAQKGERALAAETWLELARRTRDPRAAKRAVETSFYAGNAAAALSASKLWRELEPNSLPARQMRLDVLGRTGKLPEAETELNAWFSERPDDAAGILMQAHTLWPNDTDKQAVLSLIQRLAARFPTLAEASLAVSVAANNAGETEKALAAADEAIKRKPNWETAILYRAALTESRSSEETIAFLRAASARLPTSRDIKSLLARSLSDAKQLDAAYQLYAELVVAFPDSVEYLLGQALSAIQLRNYPAAEQPLTQALVMGVNKPGAIHYYLGLVAEEQGKLEAARDHYRQTDDLVQGGQGIQRLARVEARLGNKVAALQALDKLPLKTVGEQITRIQIEAQIWRDLKDLGRARSTLDAGLGKHQDSTDLLYDRSLILDQLGDIQSAEADLRRYLVLMPESTLGLNALGYTLANHTNRLDEAETLLQKAITKEPNNPVIIDSMGWLQLKRGKIDEAVKWLSRAFTDLPDPEIAAHYGEALWRAGKQAEARKVWDAGKKLDPAHEVLTETVQRLTGK